MSIFLCIKMIHFSDPFLWVKLDLMGGVSLLCIHYTVIQFLTHLCGPNFNKWEMSFFSVYWVIHLCGSNFNIGEKSLFLCITILICFCGSTFNKWEIFLFLCIHLSTFVGQSLSNGRCLFYSIFSDPLLLVKL